MGWRVLSEFERFQKVCATDDCNILADFHFEKGDVGSYYCSSCRQKLINREWAETQAHEFAVRNNP